MTHNLIKSTNAHTNEMKIDIAAKSTANAPAASPAALPATPKIKIAMIMLISKAQNGPNNVNISKVNP